MPLRLHRAAACRVTLPPGEGEEAYSTQAMAVKVSAAAPEDHWVFQLCHEVRSDGADQSAMAVFAAAVPAAGDATAVQVNANSQSRVFSSRVTLPPGEGEEAYSTQAMAVKVENPALAVCIQLCHEVRSDGADQSAMAVFAAAVPAMNEPINTINCPHIPARCFCCSLNSCSVTSSGNSWDYQDFFNDNIAKVCGVLLAWLAFQVLRPSSDARDMTPAATGI
jgi:hypothetical protein